MPKLDHHSDREDEPGRARQRRQPDERSAGVVTKLLTRVVDLALVGVVCVVPFIMGGRQALGQFTLVVLAATMSLAWSLRQCLRPRALWHPSGTEWLLLAMAGLAGAQLVE